MDQGTAAPAAPAAPVANDNAAPAAPNPISQAAKTLREARRATLREGAGKTTTASSKHSPTQQSSSSTEATEQSPPPVASEPAADEIAVLIREDRRIKAEARKVEARAAEVEAKAKQFESWAPRLSAAEAALAKGDTLAAIRAAFPDVDLTGDVFWDIAKQYGATASDDDGPSEVDFEKLVDERLTAREKAEKEASEAKRRELHQAVSQRLAEVDHQIAPGFAGDVMEIAELAGNVAAEVVGDVVEAYGEFVAATNQTFSANAAKYPAIATLGAHPRRVVETSERLRKETGNQPSTSAVLDALEKEMAARIQATPYAQRTEQPRPSPTVTSSWRSDAGRPAPVEGGRRTVDQLRAERKARLLGHG